MTLLPRCKTRRIDGLLWCDEHEREPADCAAEMAEATEALRAAAWAVVDWRDDATPLPRAEVFAALRDAIDALRAALGDDR